MPIGARKSSGNGRQPSAKMQGFMGGDQYQGPVSSAAVETMKAQAQEGASRLDAIYAQLKELQNLKDEICDDLDDFISEVDHNENVEMPDHMDQVVDIVVN